MGECWKCGAPIMLVKPDVHKSLTPGRFNLSRRQHFGQTAPQAWPTAPQPAPSRQLGEGETVYRPFSFRHDIGPQLAFATVYGAFVIVGAAGFAMGWPVVVGVDAVVCGVFTVLELDVWRGAIERYITQERTADKPPQVGGTWEAKSTVKAGSTTTIDAPHLSDPWAWHRFCVAVEGGKTFSQSESKKHKVSPADWKSVYDPWVSRGWLVPQGKRKAPVVLAVAQHHIRNYATTPPPDAG